MSETKFTDQRPRTTKAEMPEGMKALKPLGKDPEITAFIDKLKAKFLARVSEGKGEE